MPSLKISISHEILPAEVRGRLKALAGELKNLAADDIEVLAESWSGNTAKFSLLVNKCKVSAELRITDSEVRINGKIPLVLLPFRGKIKEDIEDTISEILFAT